MKTSAETLVRIEIVNAEGAVFLRGIWATTAVRRGGHRRIDIHEICDAAALPELAPAICSIFRLDPNRCSVEEWVSVSAGKRGDCQ